ncbi:MAG: hypothetical protein ACRC1J_06075 [Sandaracinobacteroides sp.]
MAKAASRRAVAHMVASLHHAYCGTAAEPLPPAIADLLRRLE